MKMYFSALSQIYHTLASLEVFPGIYIHSYAIHKVQCMQGMFVLVRGPCIYTRGGKEFIQLRLIAERFILRVCLEFYLGTTFYVFRS